MECNKDEALRAKEIAERKLVEKDVTGAKKFASKAQSLYPKLDGLPQFLEVIEVYVAREKKVNGEVDYYGILGVDPFADEETLKKQYRRMALTLHPDKNKSMGADEAFKILSEAWCVLSDKDKRSAYNLKANIRASSQAKSSNSSKAKYTASTANPQHVPTKRSTSGTGTSQPGSFASNHPRNTTSRTNSAHYRRRQRTPASTTVGDSKSNPAPRQPKNSTNSFCDPSPQEPLNPTPGTSSDCQRTPATAAQSEPIHVDSHPSNSNPHIVNHDGSIRKDGLAPRFRKGRPPVCATQFMRTAGPSFDNQNIPSQNQPSSSTCPSRPVTGWTACNRCKMHYEYWRIYLNHNLLCPRCQQPFFAMEVPVPNMN